MFCDNCGNKLRDGAKFCNNCGTSVAEETEVKSEVNANNSTQSGTSSVITQNHSANNGQPQQATFQTPPKPYYAPGTHPYHRLGGFLMFIVVGSYISGVYSLISVITTIITYSGIFSIDDINESSKDESKIPYELIVGEDIAFDVFYRRESVHTVQGFLTCLTDREKQVIMLRNGIEAQRPLTLEEIGSILGVTRERVRQIEDKALRKLRYHISRQYKHLYEI